MTIEYYEVKDVNSVAKVVREVLERFDFIEVAVIFGSVLRRSIVRDIDIGIAVNREISLEEYNEIASLLEQALNIPVDLVILNDAPPLLRFKALVEGIKVIVRDKKKLFYMITESFMELEDIFQFHFEF
jgi:predicted nucleotidyltransferase